jgi:hypothetical protein
VAQQAVSDADIFELALSEWKLTPEYILRNWTEPKLFLMIRARVRRSLRESGKETDPSKVMRKVEIPKDEPPRPVNARKTLKA